MNKLLRGQVAILSGALGDIGKAIAIELAMHGTSVALGDIRDDEDSYILQRELSNLHVRCRYDRVDVSDADAVRQWVAKTEEDLGPPEIIIPNAAVVTLARIRQLTPAQWSRELRVNLDGAFYLAQAAAKRLIKHKKAGRIVFLGSWAGHAPHSHIPAYCVSKAGLRMLCKCMAAELAEHEILVNEIAPGYVDAGLSGQVFAKDPAIREQAIKRVPLRRLITPEEVAKQVIYLCDPANRHLTGTVLLMDGGLSLRAAGISSEE